jgi:non-specific protein-tyrosine kinase
MGRTHEALERAEKEYQSHILKTALAPGKIPVTLLPRRSLKEQATEHFETLKMNLLTRVGDRSIKSILFTGTALGDGASTSAVNVAELLAKDSQFRVLLVDANLRGPCLHHIFKVDHSPGLVGLLTEREEVTNPILKVGPGGLHLVTCGRNHSEPVSLFESSRFSRFMNTMCESFDYVILDGPPVGRFSESRILGARVGGVVLVVEAGKTRRQVAQRAKKDLEEAGGEVLGIVINRRKFHIPEWIYKRL